MTSWIEPASVADYLIFMGRDKTPSSWVIREDGEAVAIAGIVDRFADGDAWVYFQTRGKLSFASRRVLMRGLRTFLIRFEHPLRASCSALANQNAEKLLRSLGFQPTGDVLNGMETWLWLPRSQC